MFDADLVYRCLSKVHGDGLFMIEKNMNRIYRNTIGRMASGTIMELVKNDLVFKEEANEL